MLVFKKTQNLLALNRSKRSIAISAVVFIIVMLMSSALMWQLEQQRMTTEKKHLGALASDKTYAIQTTLERALSATYTLGAMVRQSKGNDFDFEGIAEKMLPAYPGINMFGLSPGGVVAKVVPLEGNERAIGFNQLQDPIQSREAYLARDTGQLTLAGPLKLIQGRIGLVARLPIFLDDISPPEKPVFWGFVYGVLHFPEVIEGVRLQQLEEQGLAYCLSRTVPGTSKKQVIAESIAPLGADPVVRQLTLPNSIWTLEVSPIKGWGNPVGLSVQALLGIIFSGVLAYTTRLLLELKHHKAGLELLVARRTREMASTQKELQATLTEVKQLAFYDPLTHLPNRRLPQDRLQQALAVSARSGQHGALQFIDLDNFKTLNDTLGHGVGDLLLEQVGLRLTACVREGDTVARLGGDEFVVMLESLSKNTTEALAQARAVGEKVLAAINQPYRLLKHDVNITPSIGVTLYSGQQDTIENLLKQADLAMYQSKTAGRNTLRFFDPAMQAVVSARVGLENDIRLGIQKDEFVLHYQAQINRDGHTIGAEVLLRWSQPQRGMVSPADFIPLAEDTGLIIPLGSWVLETACAKLVMWAKNEATSHLTLAVNVSARQFRQPDFVTFVLGVLARSGASPNCLKLELTESMLVNDVEDTIAKMVALKAGGVGFSLDDFGTGYSSLSYLKRLPLDQLKIDQSFVRDLMSDPNDAAIARTVITLGHSLGLTVIAEGVETQAQRDFLSKQDCDAYQGYLFSRPLPAVDFELFVQTH